MNWHDEALRLWRLVPKEQTDDIWMPIAQAVKDCFTPDKNIYNIKESVRKYVYGTNEYKALHGEKTNDSGEEIKPEPLSTEYKSDGSIVSTRFLQLSEGQNFTPEELLTLHGFNPSLWEVSHCINNYWNSQLKGGFLQISYQSKLTARPKKQGLSFAEIDAHFATMNREHEVPQIVYKPHEGNMMAEVNIADLHLGKLCWHGDTPENYDYKIARDLFYTLINDICGQLKDKPIDYILFVWSHDFFNCDTITQTTTAGTPQDVDVRWQKLFNVGCEMLVGGIELLMQIAPVKTFYIPSNHDEMTGYHAMKYIQAWFRNDENVKIMHTAQPRYYELYGNSLIGFCHGDKENSNGTKEKASRLASLMPNEAIDLWSKAKYHEMHVAHLHSEQMIQEINGVIVRRISSPTATDTWHNQSGYIGAVRKAQTFIWDKDKGLLQTINTPV